MKTTTLGILTILSAVIGGAISLLKGGSPDLLAISSSIGAGIGLINAADATAKKK